MMFPARDMVLLQTEGIVMAATDADGVAGAKLAVTLLKSVFGIGFFGSHRNSSLVGDDLIDFVKRWH